jgi:hypothetical protein
MPSRRPAPARIFSSLTALSVLAAVSLALSACGNAHTKVTTGTYAGESGANAPYLDVGPLVYEVQLSRQLNPANPEDAAYLGGLTPAEQALAPNQAWFGVFMQVYNNTNDPHRAASNITISDTQGNVYAPVVPDLTNLYAYRPLPVPHQSRLPLPNTAASFGPTQGALLLYKIDISSYDNRPLQLKIVNPDDFSQTASAELDV